ncbi:hypothetical protein [Palleronia caenipelagi]|uniref:Uncharacterized protein n=1 Tax=Palleronia caenipelagi TaxID=2489174 RepID=A0A547QB29_9RHOB|nr:hypothetical protein [Palleronia caenipelagi]TRD23589.1 hypothetical protein FEV53_00810 [Palleronia caenipelagi]
MRYLLLCLSLLLPACVGSGGGGDIAPEVTPAIGGIAEACGVRGRALGTPVSTFPEQGKARFTLYDTNPSSSGARVFHVTGFADKCPRAIQAGNVVFGAPSVYDVLRIAGGSSVSSLVDTTYASIKRRVCGVGPTTPCPGASIDELEARTLFVTVYPRLGGAPSATLLIDRGKIVAASGG